MQRSCVVRTGGETQALVASLDGKIVFERYSEGFAADSTFLSWSMGKSVASALCGVLVAEGRMQLDAPAPVPAWRGADDPRAAITLRHLLQMRSGLSWNEDYVDDAVSDVIEMLFGSGQDDVAGYVSGQALVHAPGAEWLYSSGTTNIMTQIMGNVIGGGEAGFTAALIDDLLRPAGMQETTIRFDDAHTWIGSSFLYATAATMQLLASCSATMAWRPTAPGCYPKAGSTRPSKIMAPAQTRARVTATNGGSPATITDHLQRTVTKVNG